MRSAHKLLLLVSIACFLLAPGMWAQTSRGTVTGIISDPQSAVVPRAEVELTHRETEVKRSTTTNEAGLYRFDAVDLGNYDLSVKASGFQTFMKRGLPVQGGQIVSQDVTLAVGETRSIVEVSAQTQPILQYESATRGESITQSQITQLPLAGRDPVQLGLVLPGVTTNRFAWGTATFVVNGGRGRSNNFLIDGTENNDVSIAGQAFQILNTDAVAEVSVQTSNYDAEFGRAGGAVVNTITRSGGNSFHGTASYLLDSTIDDAITNTQSLSSEVARRGHPLPGTDQVFAGTLGGPIRREKTFFFGAFQQERQRSQSQTSLGIPTAAGRQTLDSLFPKGSNPRVDLYDQVLGSLAATAQPFMVAMGGGRPAIEFGTAITPYPQSFVENQALARVDHNISQKDMVSVRYMLDRQSTPKGYGNADFPGFFTSYGFKAHNALLSETHVFSPRTTNELRLAFNRTEMAYPNDPDNPIGATMPRYTIGGGVSGIGVSTSFPQGRLINNYSLQEAVSHTRGTHSFRFGLNINQQRARQFAPIRERGEISFGTTSGYSPFANFVDDFGGSGGAVMRDFGSAAYYPSYTRHGYFAQDRWRATRGLTLTLGVRYEYFGLPMNALKKSAYSGLFNLDPVTFDGPYREFTKVQADKNNWSPTIGLAYSPSGTGGILGKLLGGKKTVIRTGYQIGYDSFFNNIASNAAVGTPNVISTSTPSSAADGPRGIANWSTRLPVVARDPAATDSQTLIAKNLVNPYYQRWSFGVQRELPGSLQLDVSYVGSKGTRLLVNEDFNPVVPANMRILPATATPIPASRITTRFDALQGPRLTRTNGGSSSYDALQIEVRRRFAKGLSFSAAYTFSKLIDNASEVFGQSNTNSPQNTMLPSIFGGLRIDRGLSLFDRTNRAVFTYVYELPFLKDQKGPLGRVLGGWQLSGVTTFETGVPLNIYNGVDADGIGGGYDRPMYNPSGQPGVRAVPSSTGYTNPDTGNPIDPATAMYIGIPANATANALPTGNLGRNTLRAPGLNNFNVNFLKRIRIVEKFNAEFRTEFYNLWNHPQYGSANLGVSPFSPGVGAISSSVYTSPATRFLQPQYMDGGGRVIKYQLKLVF